MAEQQLRVRLLALTQGFNQNMSAAQSKLTAFGTKAKQVGASLRSIQLPLALAAGASVKMAVDFGKSMNMIKSLVGVAGAEVDAMGITAKKMAVDTGQSATDAAEALFFITSAGLRGAEAMQVLEASLKASAVGLGETKTIADLATSAMNAYGSDVLSATDATDVLVTAVREGKLEADQLAQSFGSVLPVASAMGVRFDELGAAFAALSRTGTNASEAATQIRGILTSLLKPTTDAEKALAEMGLSTQFLRKEIKERGLLAVLETLKSEFDNNDEAAQRVFGNVRALSGVMDLLGAGIDTTRSIFDSLTKSAGATEKAFRLISETAEFKLTKSLNAAKVSFVDMGAVILTEILPVIQDLSKFIVDLFKDFSRLDDSTKKFILTVGGIVLVAPTVISAIGGITAAVIALKAALLGLIARKLLVPLALLLAALSLKGDEGATDFLTQLEIKINEFESEELVKKAQETASAIDGMNQALSTPVNGSELVGAINKIKQGFDFIENELFGGKNPAFLNYFKELEIELETSAIKLKEHRELFDNLTRFDFAVDDAKIKIFASTMERTADIFRNTTDVINEELKKLSDNAVQLLNRIAGALQGAFNQIFNGENAIKSLGNAILDLVKQLAAAAAAAAILALIIAAISGGTVPFKATFGPVFQGLTGISTGGGTPGASNFFPDPAGRGSNINLSGQFRIDGQDLVVAVERANNQRSNFTG